MADTEDVAKVLYEYLTGSPYEWDYREVEAVQDEEYHPQTHDTEVLFGILKGLEILASRYHIGIEDARALLRNKDNPTL